MLQLLLFTLALWGVVYGVCQSALLVQIRVVLAVYSSFLRGLLYCPYCVSFWAGAMLALLGLYPPAWTPDGVWAWAHVPLGAFVAVGLTTVGKAWQPRLFDMSSADLELRLVGGLIAARAPDAPENPDADE